MHSQPMFVFKDGNGNNLVAYRLNVFLPGGTYESPFSDPPFDLPGGSTLHNISHISVYYIPGDPGIPPGGIPEPSSTAVLGLGLLGMGLLRLRARKKHS